LSQYEKRKPRYVREWYLRLKKRMKELKAQREEEQKIVLQASIQAAAGSPVKLRNIGTKAQTELILGLDSLKMATPIEGEDTNGRDSQQSYDAVAEY
jgi:hypothetical protein